MVIYLLTGGYQKTCLSALFAAV